MPYAHLIFESEEALCHMHIYACENQEALCHMHIYVCESEEALCHMHGYSLTAGTDEGF